MTWDEVTQTVGVKRCAGCTLGDHTRGWASRSTYTVHWADRRLTKHGLRRFLMLVASIRLVPIDQAWERLYAYNRWASHTAAQLHVRIPARYADNDRARVRWLITKEEHVSPQVKRWTRERTR